MLTFRRGVHARVKAYVVRAEDARLLGDMPLVRKMYAEVHNLNRRLVGEYAKRANNHHVSWFFGQANSRKPIIFFRVRFQSTGLLFGETQDDGVLIVNLSCYLSTNNRCRSSYRKLFACEVPERKLNSGVSHLPQTMNWANTLSEHQCLCHDWLLAWYTTTGSCHWAPQCLEERGACPPVSVCNCIALRPVVHTRHYLQP